MVKVVGGVDCIARFLFLIMKYNIPTLGTRYGELKRVLNQNKCVYEVLLLLLVTAVRYRKVPKCSLLELSGAILLAPHHS